MRRAVEPPLALTMGEPAGIGGEIALKAWLRRADDVPPFFVIDEPERLRARARALGMDVPVRAVEGPEGVAARFADFLPVLPHAVPAPVEPGNPNPANAAAVMAAVERAVALARAGRAAGLVTNPIHKRCLYDAGFAHPGHTEYLAALAGGGARPVMMLVGGTLRVVPVTVHLSLREAVDVLRGDAIVTSGKVVDVALRVDFGLAAPRLAVAALNPHGGEDGALGREEIEMIAPAVADLRKAGVTVSGPAPADSLFHEAARKTYDAVLCMYHDQALIPLKTLSFHEGVNVTLGLPFVRTSPDHGTALDIAGTGRADESSLLAALRLARDIARSRRSHADRRRTA